MSEVPDDLMKAAREACRCFDEPKGCVLLDPQSCSDDCDLAFRFSRALAAERERATLAERERISKALDDEADVIPCAEDAMVTRGNALLVRADFSYEEADRIEESSASP